MTVKQEFTNRINELSRALDKAQFKPETREEALEQTERLIIQGNVEIIKQFLDNNCEGKKPEIIVSSIYKGEERFHLARNEPENHQKIFDTLKKYDLVPEGSQISDYDFLFVC